MSKSKTFPKGTDFQEVIDFVINNIETEDREVKGVTNLDAPEVFTEIKGKLTIVITER